VSTPISTTVGGHAAALSKLLGVEVSAEDVLTILPASGVEAQWYVDNPVPTQATAGLWWTLTKPERLPLTRAEMKEAILQLDALYEELRGQWTREKADQRRSKTARLNVLDVLPELAGRMKQVRTLRQTLRGTRSDLERIHVKLTHEYERGTK
jgi:hypothetical protein